MVIHFWARIPPVYFRGGIRTKPANPGTVLLRSYDLSGILYWKQTRNVRYWQPCTQQMARVQDNDGSLTIFATR